MGTYRGQFGILHDINARWKRKGRKRRNRFRRQYERLEDDEFFRRLLLAIHEDAARKNSCACPYVSHCESTGLVWNDMEHHETNAVRGFPQKGICDPRIRIVELSFQGIR